MAVKPVDEDEKLNRQNGDEPDEEEIEDEDEDLGDEFEEDEEDVLDYVKKHTNKTFTKEGLVKTLKQMDKDFSQKRTVVPKTEKPQPTNHPDMVLEKRLLKIEQPMSNYVMEEMEAVAKKTGQSLEQLWNDESGYFQGKAEVLAEKAGDTKRVTPPSQQVEEEDDDSEEKRNSKKFFKNLPPGFKFKQQ